MAKTTKTTDVKAIASQIIALAQQLQGGEAEAPVEKAKTFEIPSTKALAKLKDAQIRELAEKLSITSDGIKIKALRATLDLASRVAADDDLTDDEVNQLATDLGLKPAKKSAATLSLIRDYLSAESTVDEAVEETEESAEEVEETEDEESDDEDTEDDESEETDEEAEETEEEESDDEKSEEDSEEDSEDDEESEETDSDDESEESDDESEEDEESEEESDEDAPSVTAANVSEYNAVAEKKLKKGDTAALTKLLTDDDGKVSAWGTPYIKKGEGYCCGLPLEGDDVGECQVTHTKWTFNDKDEFVQVKPAKKKK